MYVAIIKKVTEEMYGGGRVRRNGWEGSGSVTVTTL